eukprot:5584701-Prymnesium_polylepis.1
MALGFALTGILERTMMQPLWRREAKLKEEKTILERDLQLAHDRADDDDDIDDSVSLCTDLTSAEPSAASRSSDLRVPLRYLLFQQGEWWCREDLVVERQDLVTAGSARTQEH